ncbi:hypothetical protein SAMN05660691_03950 [Rheinheimera pacifica]|uniref:Uncharacterized protein n=1 Tax=Rheinheimera pacifica TaxID=173990 RepID=A0A1H6NBI6_9GAMM|nr:hypothetical protein [Rheinheimera pacifica]SEI12394.1 hypothetical protein SAMN05660691_03950 [Rheinheimera pacifica]
MSGVISAVKHWAADYAGAALLALLLHALLLACLLRLEFTQVPPPKPAAPVVSYLYQPPPVQAVAAQAESNAPEPESAALPSALSVTPALSAAPEPEVAALASTDNAATQADAVSEKQPAAAVASSAASFSAPFSAQPEQSSAAGLAQRALSSAATPSARAIEDAATASYQQFLQAQQPKITVEKRHQELSADPAQHMVRIKEGVCVIGDPALDGFEQLMLAKRVPCGDKDASSAILKQALEKHRKY